MRVKLANDMSGLIGAALPDCARLGRRMAALYRCWDGGPMDLAGLAACLLAPIGGTGTPIGRTCLALAAAVARWGGHAYHSAGHHAEVATNAAVLAELAGRLGQPVAAADRALLLAASLAHDIDYVPRQERPRFAAEAASAAVADGLAASCGMAPDARRDLRTLILATEPGSRAALRALPAELPAVLRPLAEQPGLASLAALLSDADLLSSAGLSERWHRVQHARLEREMGRPLAAADDRGFFDAIVGDGFLSLGGGHFTPNLRRIRAAARSEAGAGTHAGA